VHWARWLAVVPFLAGCGRDTANGGPSSHPAGGCAGQAMCPDAGNGDSGAGSVFCDESAVEPGPAWANWPVPHPPSSDLPNPASYDVRQAGVVIDNVTGLMWQETGFVELTADEATSRCAELEAAGHCDWRLPSRIELVSLVDFTRAPAIDVTAFPDVTGEYLSASTHAGSRWRIGFDGATRLLTESQVPRGSVRCVRNHGQSEAPEPRYTFAGQSPNDVVSDHGTGLVWQRRPSDATYSFSGAEAYCAGLEVEGGGFRVPSMKELQTLLDEGRGSSPLIDEQAFPGFPTTLNATFWTSSPSARSDADAWFVRGGATLDSAVDAGIDALFYVRCVK
jgi:hypothetical protein